MIRNKRLVFPVWHKEKHIDILNLILIFSASAIVFFLGAALFAGGKNIDFALKSQQRQINLVPELSFLKKSMQYYERILSQRRLFVAQSGVRKSGAKTAFSFVDKDAVLISDLQLQGIISGAERPQAIIINTRTDQSYFCQGGENIVGFKVKEVQSDRVILEKDEEIIELRL